MEVLYKSCCGIDVHKKLIVGCILDGKDASGEIREFGTNTDDLEQLADWIVNSGSQMVAMESTASYWKPVYNILEERGIPAIVVNAQHMKNVPGKKTDVKDAKWIADLLRHGLLLASYIPPRPQRELRETLIYRKSLVCENTAELNRLQKMLEGANIKLSGTVSNIIGKSGRHLLELLIEGRTITADDIRTMQKENVISRNLKATPEEIEAALKGFSTKEQRQNLSDALTHHDYLVEKIEQIEKRVKESLSEKQKKAIEHLVTIPGVSEVSAMNIIAVIGTDMTQFETADRLCSWAGICPGNKESAKKKLNARCTKGNGLLRYTLIQCAASASKAKGTFFKAKHDKLAVRRGKSKAKMAVAHSILKAIFYMLAKDEDYSDLGEDYYVMRDKQEKKAALKKKIFQLKLSKEEVLEFFKDEEDFSYNSILFDPPKK